VDAGELSGGWAGVKVAPGAAVAGGAPHPFPEVGATDGVVGAGVVVVARVGIGGAGVLGGEAVFDVSSDAVGFT
jgi:hypothetical protein